jgi:hypothetical protein
MGNPFTAHFYEMLRGKCPDHFVIGTNVICIKIGKPAVDQDQGATLVLDVFE